MAPKRLQSTVKLTVANQTIHFKWLRGGIPNDDTFTEGSQCTEIGNTRFSSVTTSNISDLSIPKQQYIYIIIIIISRSFKVE